MKQIILTEQEASVIVSLIKRSDVPINLQPFIVKLVERIERELAT